MSATSLFDLKGKVIVVTGATGTLTGSAADYFATQGARVVYLGRTQSKLDAALAKIRTAHPAAEVMALAADVSDRPALDEITRRTEADSWRTRTLILALTESAPFQRMRSASE